MACGRPSPVVTFEHDVPTIVFTVAEEGVPANPINPVNLINYDPELHVLKSDGTPQAVFGLVNIGRGRLSFEARDEQTLSEFYEALNALEVDVNYSCQIYLRPGTPPSPDIGLYDIVDPYWMDYIPPEDHLPGYFSGEVRAAQTIPVEFPWDIRESFRLREASNG